MPKGFRHCHFAVVWRRARWVTVSQTGMGNWEEKRDLQNLGQYRSKWGSLLQIYVLYK